jgi:hypothetical protein
MLWPLRPTASRIGVPANWLRREAEAGRVPCLHAGSHFYFDVELVERALLERARCLTADSTPNMSAGAEVQR